jgi:hypothetical protein
MKWLTHTSGGELDVARTATIVVFVIWLGLVIWNGGVI